MLTRHNYLWYLQGGKKKNKPKKSSKL